MNFALFPVESTNIFPIANSVNGGQLVTEFNLKSRESVSTDPTVAYIIGHSFTHGERDFYVRTQADADDYFESTATTSSSVLEILPGRAVVNGHYIENLTSMVIDLAAVNAELNAEGQSLLSGDLSIGLRVMYSTSSTMSGSILPEESSSIGEVYEGIQVIILPTDEFLLPTSYTTIDDEEIYCGDDGNEIYVTAHLLLATFKFVNGQIVNIVQNPNKMQMLSAERIESIDRVIQGDYVKKSGLNQNKLYVFAGKGENPETGFDTWCSAEDALIVWDSLPQLGTNVPAYTQATFTTTESGKTALVLPHKQIDNASAGYAPENSSGDLMYYQPRVLQLPLADFNTETPGTINGSYTAQVKRVAKLVSDLYSLPGSKQRGYVDDLTDISDLPELNQNWDVGDYILVNRDSTVEYDDLNSEARPPSTIYVVLAGQVTAIRYYGTEIGTLSGVELASVVMSAADGDTAPDTSDPDVYSAYWGDLLSQVYRGSVDIDYFTVVYTDENSNTTTYYYNVAGASSTKVYSEQIYITRPVPYADQTTVGGFLDVDTTSTDNGYVYLDSDGHLRLLDYQLLRSGTLAYQLGEDFTAPTGLTLAEIQAYLDEYVNQRVAFPNAAQIQNAEYPNVIQVTINITGDDTGGTLDIYDIDSRFGTSVLINILGTAQSNVTINVSDCQKVRINSYIEGSPVINLYRSSLYYDYSILNYLTIIRDLKLWYEQFDSSEPNIVVDNMTVSAAAINGTYSDIGNVPIDFWNTDSPNDNHFSIGLKSITLGSTGVIEGCTVAVRNDSTSNVETGTFITHATDFELPQGPDLYYPASLMTKHVKVTGEFISAYTISSPSGYMIQNTQFSMRTPIYDTAQNMTDHGEIAFLVTASTLSTDAPDQIDVWNPSTFHFFTGAAL